MPWLKVGEKRATLLIATTGVEPVLLQKKGDVLGSLQLCTLTSTDRAEPKEICISHPYTSEP